MAKEYALYLESGPRRCTTMVHVLDLLGCFARGVTTEAALAATPEAIRAFLQFLRHHREMVEPEDRFTTTIAEHVTKGAWLGYRDPTPGFGPDFQPLTAEDLSAYLRRLAWLHDDPLQLIRDLAPEQLTAEPDGGGWSIYRIVEHVAESESNHLRMLVGKTEGLSAALRAMQPHPEAAASSLASLWQTIGNRLAALTEAEREQQIPHGQVTWTARRALRRLLEHDWEHLQQIMKRIGRNDGLISGQQSERAGSGV